MSLIGFSDQFRGDPNLQTTISGQTLFHMAVNGPVLDLDLVQKMVELRSFINLTDYHGTTPLMDMVKLKRHPREKEERAIAVFDYVETMGKVSVHAFPVSEA